MSPRTSVFAAATVAVTFAMGGGAVGAEPVKLWELSGVKTPESVRPDPAGQVLYVSNINGEPLNKDGNGFISKVSPEGKMIQAEWATGLDAPKGIAIAGDRLFVSDIDRLVEIELASGKVLKRHQASGAQFLNDVAADAQGRVYVSDMFTNTVWRLADGSLEPWLQSDSLMSPNGLHVQDERLIVAAWGVRTEGFATNTPGHLIAVGLEDKAVRDLGTTPIGNLDGLERLEGGAFLATDWMAGALYRISPEGSAEQLLDFDQGSADLGYLPERRVVVVPMMMQDKLVAYRLE